MRRNFQALLLLLASGFVSIASAQAIKEGRDYETLSQPLAVSEDGKVSVIEFFSYGCGHCFNFESKLHAWEQARVNKIDFTLSPVTFPGSAWAAKHFAEIYYALEAMGVLEQHHQGVYEAVHQKKLNFGKQDVLHKWLAERKVDVTKFEEIRKSFAMQSSLKSAELRVNDAGVDSTPQIIVGGKYRVLSVGSFDRILEVADKLVTRIAFKKRTTK